MYEAKPPVVTDPTVTDSAPTRTEPSWTLSNRPEGMPAEASTPPLPWRLVSDFLHFVVPRICLACREPIPWTPPSLTGRPSKVNLGLCAPCRSALVTATERNCLQCGVPLDDTLGHQPIDAPNSGWMAAQCPECVTPSSTGIHQCFSLWSYQPPLDAVMQGLKFQRLPYLARHLGAAIAQRLGDYRHELEDIDAVVPVPLHWRRRLQRGFDQTFLLAQSVAAGLDLPMCPILRRRRATSAQSRLSREARQRNLTRAFVPRRRASPWGANPHFLLVDDVVTTGATLMAAGEALQHVQPCRITAVTAGRTPSQAHMPSP